MNRSTQIMMIVPDIENPFYSVAYKVVQDIALQKGYTVTLYNSNGIEGNELNAIEIAHGLKIDGLIFCSINDYPQVFKALKDFGKPVVASNSFGELNFDTVHSIKGQGLYVTTNYLLSLGHTKIAYAGGDENSVLNERRFTGYQKALSEAGINLRPEYVFNFDFSMEGGYRAAKYFIGLSELPAAIACANDLIAMGVIQTLIGNGNRVPEDVSVTGMDNIEFSKLCMPPITTVTNNSREFAENCMELLLTRISQEYEGAPREYLTSRKLVVRESTR
jgi:LacI family transcriptional regulator